MHLRLLVDDGASAAAGLAVDETLARRVGEGLSPPTVRLYTYRPHCVLVGRFQDASHEVELPACERAGIDVNRRPTGGGAILMGPDQLGIALALPRSSGNARELMTRFSRRITGALAELGIDAVFRGKNDLAVKGRKIAGLGIYRDASGGLLFHASLLVDLDVALMVRVLRTPFRNVGDREIGVVSRRIATVRGLVGQNVSMTEVKERVARAFESAAARELDDDERAAALALERDRYRDPGWIDRQTEVPDSSGRATLRHPGGVVDVRVAMAGRTIKAAWVRGDFFVDDQVVAELEGRLRWHPSDRDAIAETVRTACAAGNHAGTVDTEAFTDAISAAVARSIEGVAAPYGCFVTPEASRD